jgi:hypothetical protein
VVEVYWQRGTKQRPLRLIVIAPTPYRKRKSKKLYYRDPAYLLTTDLRSSTRQLLRIYFDRWQIGVSSQGHIVQSVRDRPGSKDSDLVAGEAPWRQAIIARRRFLTTRTAPGYAGMRLYGDHDPRRIPLQTMHAHFLVYEPDKSLHLIQDGFNLKLNSRSP